jgi:hypothetical protein
MVGVQGAGLLEVRAVYPDNAWVVDSVPGEPCALPVVDPSLHCSWKRSDRYNGDSVSNKVHQHQKSHLMLQDECNIV